MLKYERTDIINQLLQMVYPQVIYNTHSSLTNYSDNYQDPECINDRELNDGYEVNKGTT